MTNKLNSVPYTGVTSNLEKRVHEHKSKLIEGFTKKYNVDKLKEKNGDRPLLFKKVKKSSLSPFFKIDQ